MTSIWALFVIIGNLSPELNYLTKYDSMEPCQQAVRELKEKNIKSVCVPWQIQEKK